MKKQILKFLEEEKIKLLEYPFLEDSEHLYYELEENELLGRFSVYARGHDGDYSLQAEYYSEKLGKTIIWDYDFPHVNDFNNSEEFADFLEKTINDIEEFENKLPQV